MARTKKENTVKAEDSKAGVRDKLVNAIYDEINSSETSFGAFKLDDPEWNPTDITDWVSTGNPIMDIIISNRKKGGIPVGRITEINGLSSSGKSLLVAHILRETQVQGGIPILIDTEHSADRDFLKAMGLDFSNFIYAPIPIIEDVLQAIESIIEKVRKSDSDRLIVIAVDSVMGATNKTEDETDYDVQGYATQKARILSQAMRKITKTVAEHKIALIFTNQLRSNLNAGFGGDPWTTSGGMAIAFHASLRLRLKMKMRIKIGKDSDPIGVRSNCQVIKSRIGPPFRSCDFDMYFDRGFDDITTWFEVGKKYNVIIKAKKLEDESKPESPKNKLKEMGGGWFMLAQDQEMKRFQNASIGETILNDPIRKQMLYDGLCDAIIMKYVDRDSAEAIDKSTLELEDMLEDL